MKAMFSAVVCIFLFKVCESAVIQKSSMRMDEVIMHAAYSPQMFDFAHMMDGEIMFMLELDLLLNQTEVANYKLRDTKSRTKRKATSQDNQLWSDCNVYYEIAPDDFSTRDIQVIQQAIREWENFTCLEFTESSTESSRIRFRNGGGCYSRLGRTGGVQPLSLAPGCRTKGVVVHEIGHAIGWIHEQARPDRDEFITVNFEQIPPNWRSQFAKVRDELIDDRDVTYDYDSIMHYSGNVFGPRTIITRDPAAQNRLGQRRGLSFRDIKLANLMYRCAERMDCPTDPCPGEGFRTKACKCVCPGPIGNPLVSCDGRPITTEAPVATTTTESTPTTTGTECRDLRLDCETHKANGSCTRDVERMSVFCRRTCDLCNTEGACMDYDATCTLFARGGYCERDGFGEFFKQECPLSCGICEPVDRCQALLDSLSSSERHQVSIVATIVMFIAVFVCGA